MIGHVVMRRAERDTVGEIGPAAFAPRGLVMNLGPVRRAVTVRRRAPAMGVGQGDSLVLGKQSALPAEVLRDRFATQNHWDDACLAGQPSSFACADLLSGIKAVSYTHLRAHETVLDLVCRLLLEKK